MACGSNFKKILYPVSVVLFAVSGCEIPHDNPLDPANPESSRPRKTLIEAFVNLNTGFPYDEYVVDALDSLATLYPDRIAIAEYHRNVPDHPSKYHRDENDYLYQQYLDVIESDLKGVPDVFINGTEIRIPGASDKSSAFSQLQQAVLARASDTGLYTIEIKASVSGSRITPHITLARLGNSDAENLIVRAVLVSRIASPRYARVVSGTVTGTVIDKLNRGQVIKITLPAMQSDTLFTRELIACVCDQNKKTIYQIEKARIDR